MPLRSGGRFHDVGGCVLGSIDLVSGAAPADRVGRTAIGGSISNVTGGLTELVTGDYRRGQGGLLNRISDGLGSGVRRGGLTRKLGASEAVGRGRVRGGRRRNCAVSVWPFIDHICPIWQFGYGRRRDGQGRIGDRREQFINVGFNLSVLGFL